MKTLRPHLFPLLLLTVLALLAWPGSARAAGEEPGGQAVTASGPAQPAPPADGTQPERSGGPEATPAVPRRVDRGGGMGDQARSLRAAQRNWDVPTHNSASLGFRCAR
ncbi:MAG: hypothetical protein FJ125_01905 [Deltaproteobacteria bacterium]|nr:hypothetical protein [Deltaproteobacteria bacterium]